MTFETRGMIAYLLSKPNNWEMRVGNLLNASPAGRDKVRRMIREAIEFGYMVRIKEKDESGKFHWVTTLYENPTIDGKTVDGSTVGGKPVDIINTDKVITDEPKELSPTAKTKSPYIQAMEELENHFAKIRGCSPPDWNGDAKASQKLWRTPLKNLWNEGDQNTEYVKQVITHSINKMIADKLVVVTPIQIEKIALDHIYTSKKQAYRATKEPMTREELIQKRGF